MSFGSGKFGFGAWGGTNPVEIASVVSVSGTLLRMTFTQEMENNADLVDASNYSATAIFGAPVTINSVERETATSVLLLTSGTTVTGRYRFEAQNLLSVSGNTLSLANNYAYVLTKGTAPEVSSITPISGNEIQFNFNQEMLEESVVSGIGQLGSYDFTQDPASFPVSLTKQTITHPYSGNPNQVVMEVQGMTSLSYTCRVDNPDAILYEGSELPSASGDFSGVEIGLGVTLVDGDRIVVTKSTGDTYGWTFEDLTGKLVTGSNFQIDFRMDGSAGVFVPALVNTTLFTLTVSDGTNQFHLHFGQGAISQDIITFESGVNTEVIEVDWSGLECNVSIYRNQQSGHLGLMVDDVPVMSIDISNIVEAASIIGGGAGCQWQFTSTHDVAGYALYDLNVYSTTTLFSSAWNFLISSPVTFVGSSALAVASVLTENGPLTKGWGNAYPATTNDVEVLVNGTAVPLSSLNPYYGEIFFTYPIPRMPVGTLTVTTSYKWFRNPVMRFAKLNTKGLVFNKGGARRLRSNDVNTSRFALENRFDEQTNPQPLQVAHQFFGFRRSTSALLNSPVRLRYNQSQKRLQNQNKKRVVFPTYGFYSGKQSPQEFGWQSQGDASNNSVVNNAYFQIQDLSGQPLKNGTESFYYRLEDLSSTSAIQMAIKLRIVQTSGDGEPFTGVGFGFHNNTSLMLLGLLKHNNVYHYGLLQDAKNIHLIGSWKLAFTQSVQIESATSCLAETTESPSALPTPFQFQIISGNKAGVYTVKTVDNLSTGQQRWTLDTTTPFTNPNQLQDTIQNVALCIEAAEWQSARLAYQNGELEFQLSGAISGLGLTSTTFANPVDTNLFLNTKERGQYFWGSLSVQESNTCEFQFVSHSQTPTGDFQVGRELVVSTDMSVLPTEDSNSLWFENQGYGFASADGALSVKSSQNDLSLDLSYGYERTEPFLVKRSFFTAEMTTRIESQRQGASKFFEVNNTHRNISLYSLLYRESGSERFLIDLPTVRVLGIEPPQEDAWVESADFEFTLEVLPRKTSLLQSSLEKGFLSKDIDLTGVNFTDTGSRILETRILWKESSVGDSSFFIACEGGSVGTERSIGLVWSAQDGLTPAKVTLGSFNAAYTAFTPVESYNFDFEDGEFHTYRVLVQTGSNAVSLVIDNQAQLPVKNLTTDFTSAASNTNVVYGFYDGSSTVELEMESLFCHTDVPGDSRRTLGVWLGGDESDINSFEIPRSDSLTVPNSDLSAVVFEMTATADMDIRVHRDPKWGVSVFRPDLAAPPYFTGDFFSEITEPSAAWINVEEPYLPGRTKRLGSVSFGCLSSNDLTQQVWDHLSYRLYDKPAFVDPNVRLMKINTSDPITSGELRTDTDIEELSVDRLDSRTVSLRTVDYFFSRVYQIKDGATIYTPDQFTTFKDNQTIELNTPNTFTNSTVTVSFAPGRPVTKTYLQNTDFLRVVRLLNDTTPPFEKSQQKNQVRTVSTIGLVEDSTTSDSITDSGRKVTFTETADSKYSVEFLERTQGESGLLKPFCEGNVTLEISGDSFHEYDTFLPKDPFSGDGPLILGGGAEEGQGLLNTDNTLYSNHPEDSSITIIVRDSVTKAIIEVDKRKA
jgi:hypothetical protein